MTVGEYATASYQDRRCLENDRMDKEERIECAIAEYPALRVTLTP